MCRLVFSEIQATDGRNLAITAQEPHFRQAKQLFPHVLIETDLARVKMHSHKLKLHQLINFCFLQVIHSPWGLQIRKGRCFQSISKSSFSKTSNRSGCWAVNLSLYIKDKKSEFHLCKYVCCLCKSSDRIKARHPTCPAKHKTTCWINRRD